MPNDDAARPDRQESSSAPLDPLVVEVTRGDAVESWHRGAYAVVDTQGSVVLRGGDIDRAIFPRSAIKPIQALALVETGAAERLDLGDEEIAWPAPAQR